MFIRPLLLTIGLLAACRIGGANPVAESAAAATGVSSLTSTSSTITAAAFTKVADEGGTYVTLAAVAVRYGDPTTNRWTTKTVNGTGQCSNSYFGGDPAPGSYKRCEVPTGSIVPYSKVGDQGQPFFTAPGVLVRYGVATRNRWIYRKLNGYGECTVAYFGGDPAVGTIKTCEAPTASLLAAEPAPVYSAKSGQMPVVDLNKIPPTWAGSAALQVTATSEIAPSSNDGDFRTVCGVARIGFDDPIVYPGQAGRSHLHTFFGNTGVNANSTPESLRTTGNSTCRGGIANRSAYWIPTLIDIRTASPVIPDDNGVYYKQGYLIAAAKIQPIPVGLRMIAGDPSRSTPGPQSVTRFKCIGGPNHQNDNYGSSIPNCDVGAGMWQEIMFPQCWDGVNLDSPDHKSHMSYVSNTSAGYACPATHPIPIPAIGFNVVYTVTEKNQSQYWRLSSDNYSTTLPAGYSSHADWFNGWDNDISDAWAKNCIAASKDCHSHLLGDGRRIY